jgi:hypothetical protein
MAQTVLAAVSVVGPVLALVFQALVLSRFLIPRNRDYPLAILFSLVLFVMTIVAIALRFAPNVVVFTIDFGVGYSFAELLMHILLLALMLQLARQTLEAAKQPTGLIAVLAGVSALVAITAYVFFSSTAAASEVFVRVRQVVSFWMVLINLYWWSLLVRARKLDRRILLLSAGIGLMMTGQVIGDGLFAIAGRNRWLYVASYLVMFLTHYACLYSWFRGFSTANVKGPADTKL